MFQGITNIPESVGYYSWKVVSLEFCMILLKKKLLLEDYGCMGENSEELKHSAKPSSDIFFEEYYPRGCHTVDYFHITTDNDPDWRRLDIFCTDDSPTYLPGIFSRPVQIPHLHLWWRAASGSTANPHCEKWCNRLVSHYIPSNYQTRDGGSDSDFPFPASYSALG